MSTAIGPRPVLPPEAARLFALADDHGESPILFRAVLDSSSPAALQSFMDEAWSRGCVYDYRLTDDEPDPGEAALIDVFDANGERVHDLAVPTDAAWEWWLGAAEMRREGFATEVTARNVILGVLSAEVAP